MRRWQFAGLILAVLWLFIRGVTASTFIGEALIGLGLGMAVAYLLRRMYPGRVDVAHNLAATPYLVAYIASFAWEMVTANFDVARRVLSPSMPIDPAIIEVPIRLTDPAAITVLANSITLTPGTLTLDHDPAKKVLYVHAIVATDDAAVIAPIRRWESLLCKIFHDGGEPYGD